MTRRDLLLAAPLAPFAMPDPSAQDLTPLLEPILARNRLPALAAVVVLGGKMVGLGAVGVRKFGDPAKVTATDQFHLGSCTKAMTAVLVAQLVQEGKLRWETRLPDLFPDVHPGLRDATVDHLLAHRAGLSANSNPPGASTWELISSGRLPSVPRAQRREFARLVLAEQPESAPGAVYRYANRGFAILGAIVEKLRDAPWERVMQERIFKPLAVKSGGFGAMGTKGKLDQPLQHRLVAGIRMPVEPGPQADNPPSIGPGGTAHCSVGDWGTFLAAVLDGEKSGSLRLRSATWRRLLSPQFGGEYAGGWIVTRRDWGGRVLNHAGSNNQNFCVAWLSPEKGFGVGAMTNLGGDDAAKACDEVSGTMVGKFLAAGGRQ